MLSDAKVLLIGCGGVGCEVLKNLVMVGLKNIHVIDMDTISVSNLNRQFLFGNEHVGQAKSLVAAKRMEQFASHVNITAIVADVMKDKTLDINFFKSFKLVINALDNVSARSHVNRMCLLADVPLIETGTAGYSGQTTLIKKNQYECYSCTPKPTQKTFPICTIRNTPSQPVHCIVWAKFLFNQLFNDADSEIDVHLEEEDGENNGVRNGDDGPTLKKLKKEEQKSIRQFASDVNFDSHKLLTRIYWDDIKYLLELTHLWKNRKPPTPLSFEEDKLAQNGISHIDDEVIPTLCMSAKVFSQTLETLHKKSKVDGDLFFDKDDTDSMRFAWAAATLRMIAFSIPPINLFDTKQIAGSIIPAIATSNAIVAGLACMEALKVLLGVGKPTPTYIQSAPNPSGSLFTISKNGPEKPNPKCYVCSSSTAHFEIQCDWSRTKLSSLNKFLIKQFHFVEPDAMIDDGSGRLIIDSEEGSDNDDRCLSAAFHGFTGVTPLTVIDNVQDLKVKLMVKDRPVKKDKDGTDDEVNGGDDSSDTQEFVVTQI